MHSECSVTKAEHLHFNHNVSCKSFVWLGRSISETARLVGCSRSTVASTYRSSLRDKPQTDDRALGAQGSSMHEGNEGCPIWYQLTEATQATQVFKFESFSDGRNASQRAVRSSLLHVGPRSRRPVRVLALTPVRCRKRLQRPRECRDWTSEHWKKVTWFDESCFPLHHVHSWVRVRRSPVEEAALGCTVERRQAVQGGSMMLWAMFCRETLSICVDVITYQNIIADQVHPFMAMLFWWHWPLSEGCHTAQIVWEWFEEGVALASKFPIFQSNRASVGCAGKTSWILCSSTSQLAGLKGSAAKVLVPQGTFRGLVEPWWISAVSAARRGPTAY